METALELDFADGRYRFWLPLPQILELERKGGSADQAKSIFTMYDEMGGGLGLSGETPIYLGGGAAMTTDVREVIRLALIGGNHGLVDGKEIEVGPLTAKQLVDAYVYPTRPLTEGLHVAWSILHAAIVGVRLKKKAEPDVAQPTSRSTKVKSS